MLALQPVTTALTLVRSLRNVEHRTLTLLKTVLKTFTSQHVRYVTLTWLTLTNNPLPICLLVSLVCANEVAAFLDVTTAGL